MNTERAFEELIASYTPTVYGVALTHTRTRADADDVFQEVFAALWRANPAFSSNEHCKAWLIRTTLNQCKKLTQSSWAKRTSYLDGEADAGEHTLAAARDEAGGASPAPLGYDASCGSAAYDAPGGAAFALPATALGSYPFANQQQRDLARAMDALTAEQREVVQLFYFEDLSIASIAQALEQQEGTVKTRLSRARAKLRELMKGGTEDD